MIYTLPCSCTSLGYDFYTVAKNPILLKSKAGANSRPADLYFPCWKHGKPAALDVTVISPLQKLTIQEASVTQGHALSVADRRKRASHQSACQAAGLSFVPLAIETLGGWSEEAVEAIRYIGRLQGQRLGLSISETIAHLFQSLVVQLWKGMPVCGPYAPLCGPLALMVFISNTVVIIFIIIIIIIIIIIQEK